MNKTKQTNSNIKIAKYLKNFWIMAVITLGIAVAIIILKSQKAGQTGDEIKTINAIVLQENVEVNEIKEFSIDLGYGLEITELGSYNGVFMEDGSDDIVSEVLMIVVTNYGEDSIQYAEISVTGDECEAKFSLSTLRPGDSVVLLEQTRMAYDQEIDFTNAAANNVAVFSNEMSLHEELFSIQTLDGAFNVMNISGNDIAGDVYIYYKSSSLDMFYGGITYRAKIEGGMKSNEIKQVMTNHFSVSGSTIMFVTIAGE